MSIAAAVSWVSGGSTRCDVRGNPPATGLTSVPEMVQASVTSVCPVWSAGTSSRANSPRDRKAAESTRTPTNTLSTRSGPQQSRRQAGTAAAARAATSAFAACRYAVMMSSENPATWNARATPGMSSRDAGDGRDRGYRGPTREPQRRVIHVADLIQPTAKGKSGTVSDRALASPRVVNIEDLRQLARRRLPRVVFDYLDGGAEGEVTLRENGRAFHAVTFRPRHAVSVSGVDLRTTVLGRELALPVLLAPVGYSRVMHVAGEPAAARAAGAAGTAYILSTMSGHSLEDVKAASSGPVWYQLYLLGGRAAAEAAIRRAGRRRVQSRGAPARRRRRFAARAPRGREGRRRPGRGPDGRGHPSRQRHREGALPRRPGRAGRPRLCLRPRRRGRGGCRPRARDPARRLGADAAAPGTSGGRHAQSVLRGRFRLTPLPRVTT